MRILLAELWLNEHSHVSLVQFVPVVTLGRTVLGAAAAPTTAPVIPSTAPVSVIQDGLVATAPSVRSLSKMIKKIHDDYDIYIPT